MRQLEHAEVKNERQHYPIRVMCPDWANPRNVGSAFRLADAAGLAGLVLAGTTPCPPNPKISKTARSTVRSVAWEAAQDPLAYLGAAKEAGMILVALEVTDTAESLFTYSLPRTVVKGEAELLLITGAEISGVPQEILDLCDASVFLPMHGQNTSMNVAVALGAAVYVLLGKFTGGDEGVATP